MIRPFLPLLALTLAPACHSPGGPPIHVLAPEINATLAPVEGTIVAGDVLALSFVNFTEVEQADLSQERLVVPLDGAIQLPGVGTVRAAGRTPAQLEALVREAYTPVLGVPPAVAVGYASQVERSYTITGAVPDGGSFPIEADGRVTLVEAIARAGGATYLLSYLGNVVLVRWDAAEQRQVAWIVDARPKWWDEPETIYLQANDLVYVPDTTVAKVNAWVERYIIRMIPFPRFIVPPS